jgi:hypothetical protein
MTLAISRSDLGKPRNMSVRAVSVSGRGSNQGPSEYKSKVLPLQQPDRQKLL